MRIIDVHTHAFPDALAERAIPQLEAEGGIRAKLDGKISSLLRSMDETGIEKAVVCSIATKPEQFPTILKWSASIASERLFPFPSIHPADSAATERVKAAHDEGFRGIKLHPYYQEFYIDEERMLPIYEAIERWGLILLMHTGFDFAFERVRRGDPVRIARVLDRFPRLKFLATHFCSWDDWEEVRSILLGRPMYTDISMPFQFMGEERAREFFATHPREYVLFGTDSPWAGQEETLQWLRALKLGEEHERCILRDNAVKLLGLS